VIEGYSIRQLVHFSGHSRSTIQRIIRYWLGRMPPSSGDATGEHYMIFDGTFLDYRRGMYAVMDGITHSILHGAYGVKEGPPDLSNFCHQLAARGIIPKSATIDGNPHVFHVIKSIWPQIPIQRCVVHIQRQGLLWCRRHPKRTDARRLRRLFLMVTQIENEARRNQFQRAVAHWEQHYGPGLVSTTNRGWVTTDLQRARSMILKALPLMFAYLDDHNIPRTTNALEGYYGRLKLRYRQHCGLSVAQRANYFRWYFALCPR
jgi:transposase-like protein